MTKKYSSTRTHHILSKGRHRVAIERIDNKRMTKGDKERLDRCMEGLLDLRDTELGHRVNKGG